MATTIGTITTDNLLGTCAGRSKALIERATKRRLVFQRRLSHLLQIV